METYIIPILIFSGIGLVAGILLSVASKAFEVKVDERVERVSDALPQINCGACGYAGCADYASAVIEKNESTTLCKPGGSDVVEEISNILGKNVVDVVRDRKSTRLNSSHL